MLAGELEGIFALYLRYPEIARIKPGWWWAREGTPEER